ncbi:MAG: serine hydrolase [Dissulfurispiraceae bacterium]|jgi:D-alanyl-D-alanine carboxypeptidase (penicillin-binding protein 5/6)|nr:serine hydrolase [Dissulfurispiraceae bacterium]
MHYISRLLKSIFLIFILATTSATVCSAAEALTVDTISARSAIVLDPRNDRILYGINPNIKHPPASTTKIITAMVVIDRLDPDAVVVISRNAASTASVAPHLVAGSKLTVRDLLYITLMRSVNGAAVALAEAAAGSEAEFAKLMNEKALEIGADNTVYVNASGLPGTGQYTTAYDLARIMKASLDYPLIREIINTRTKHVETESGRSMFLKNTNELLWSDEDLLGGKTGYTRAARHCFVGAAAKDGNMLITVVLGESVRENLWHDTTALMDRGQSVLNNTAEPVINITSSDDERFIKKTTYRSNVKKNKASVKSRSPKSKKGAAAASRTKVRKNRSTQSIKVDGTNKDDAFSDRMNKTEKGS